MNRLRADGRTPYAIAVMFGNEEVARWLLAHGASAELAEVDRFVAACRRGDREAAEAMVSGQPELLRAIGPEHHEVFLAAAQRNDTRALAVMLACGFDPNRGDASIGKTVLHVAAAEGWVDAVRLLLDNGAAVDVRDREFHATPLVWAAEHFRMHREGREYDAVGKMLIAAGSVMAWEGGEEPAGELEESLARWRGLFAGQ